MKLLPPENQTSWAFSYLSMLVLWAPPTRMLFPQEFTGLTPSIHLCITLKVITSKLTSPTILSKHQPHHSSALAFTLCGWVWYLQKFTLAFSCRTWAAQLQDTTTSLHPKGMIMEVVCAASRSAAQSLGLPSTRSLPSYCYFRLSGHPVTVMQITTWP